MERYAAARNSRSREHSVNTLSASAHTPLQAYRDTKSNMAPQLSQSMRVASADEEAPIMESEAFDNFDRTSVSSRTSLLAFPASRLKHPPPTGFKPPTNAAFSVYDSVRRSNRFQPRYSSHPRLSEDGSPTSTISSIDLMEYGNTPVSRDSDPELDISRERDSTVIMPLSHRSSRGLSNQTSLDNSNQEEGRSRTRTLNNSELPMLEMERESSHYKDVDAIKCDPGRLTKTTNIVDEDGLLMTRESLMMNVEQLDRGSVVKEGLLFKQGIGLMHGGWKVRYVKLTADAMTFYKEQNGRKRGEIKLSNCASEKPVEAMPRDSVFDGANATMWRFALRGKKNRRIVFAAYTEGEMKEWLRCLHVALTIQRGGQGRYTDVYIPSGTFLADKSDGQMRSSGGYGR